MGNKEPQKLKIKVKPGARENKVENIGDNWVVKLKAIPEKGKANQALIKILAEHFKIAQSRIKIVSGANSRNKIISID